MLQFTLSTFQALTTELLHDVFRLRQDIFIVEQACAYADIDGSDPDWLHLCAFDAEGLVAYARLRSPHSGPAQIGRVLVHPRGRRKGYGRALMKQAMAAIKQGDPNKMIHISAQSYLLEFYQSLGFLVIGNEYLEDGIPHRHMEFHP